LLRKVRSSGVISGGPKSKRIASLYWTTAKVGYRRSGSPSKL